MQGQQVSWGGIQSGSPARARHVLIADDPIMCVAIQLPRTAVLVCAHPTTHVVFNTQQHLCCALTAVDADAGVCSACAAVLHICDSQRLWRKIVLPLKGPVCSTDVLSSGVSNGRSTVMVWMPATHKRWTTTHGRRTVTHDIQHTRAP
jgi:hypothetical protein